MYNFDNPFVRRTALLTSVAVALALAVPRTAKAIPSYSRQTGLSCATCHTVFPHLTPFGRDFKLHGYVSNNTQLLSDHASTSDTASQGRTILEFPATPMGFCQDLFKVELPAGKRQRDRSPWSCDRRTGFHLQSRRLWR